MESVKIDKDVLRKAIENGVYCFLDSSEGTSLLSYAFSNSIVSGVNRFFEENKSEILNHLENTFCRTFKEFLEENKTEILRIVKEEKNTN